MQEIGAPKISVVIASCREPQLLDACLKSLYPQCREQQAEIVVARGCDPKEIGELTKRYPFVRFIAAPGAAIPHLRAAGLGAATGDMLVLTEDHCIPCSDWVGQLVNALEDGAAVVGGAMDNAQRERTEDWAAYFAEYGFFAENGGGCPPEPLLTAANVAYSRCVLNHVIKWAQQGEWENVIHAHLLGRGHSLRFLRTATVYQNKNYGFWEFCCDRFFHGRDYARRRLVDESSRRWLYLAGTLVLPPVLTLRVAQAVGTQHCWPFFRALPITFAFLTAWAVGEAFGYWHGPTELRTSRG